LSFSGAPILEPLVVSALDSRRRGESARRVINGVVGDGDGDDGNSVSRDADAEDGRDMPVPAIERRATTVSCSERGGDDDDGGCETRRAVLGPDRARTTTMEEEAPFDDVLFSRPEAGRVAHAIRTGSGRFAIVDDDGTATAGADTFGGPTVDGADVAAAAAAAPLGDVAWRSAESGRVARRVRGDDRDEDDDAWSYACGVADAAC
jgi:hypothetical protein